jgi:cob(I)alamin adenosyltransferase
MPIYTKKGDKGTTSLIDGTKVSKGSAIPHAVGTVDELNAHLGMAKRLLRDAQEMQTGDQDFIVVIQKDLFCIGSYLAGKKDGIKDLDAHILNFETIIDKITNDLPELKNFILPGGSQVGAQLHIARTVCRRAERAVVEVEQNETILKYLNRLSDLLFMMARTCNSNMQEDEIIWNKKNEDKEVVEGETIKPS